jgi:predicted ester cyclase
MKTRTIGPILAVVFCCAAGCSDQQLQGELAGLRAHSDLLEANKALVLRTHEEVWSKGNLAVIDELYSPEYVAHWGDEDDTDREDIKTLVTKARTALPDLTEDVVHIVAEGDLVVTYFTSSGTFTGEMNGLEPTGNAVSRPEIAVHRIVDGKIVEQWTVADQLTLMKQLGLM